MRVSGTKSAIPVMPRIQWLAALVAPDLAARLLQALLVRVVARTTERLPVGSIPEQRHVATVRDDVVDDAGRLYDPLALAASAQRVFA